MTLEVGNRGRGGGSRGRGGRGDRGGGRGISRGFRGGDVRGRGGRGFSRGGDRGSFRGGERGSFRGGERGSFRGGERGSFRGGDRGSFRGTFRGGNQGAPARGAFMGGKRDVNGSSVGKIKTKPPICHEIAHALQLRICYKSDIPTEEVLKQLPGFHSRFKKPADSNDYFILFKTIESLEAAKARLEEDDTIESVDYMGLKSERYQHNSLGDRQVFLQFHSPQSVEAVKKLDEKIMSVTFMKSNSSCLAEFPSVEEAHEFIKNTTVSVDRGQLKYCTKSTAMETLRVANASIQRDQIVVRDIPKKATLKELAQLFPDANSVTLFNKTFPTSDYCHAAFRFEDAERVKAILAANPTNEILGKKVYIGPAYECLLTDMPKLGEPWLGDKTVTEPTKDSKESPNKKMKLEKDVNGGEEEEEEEEEGEDEENEENDDEENEEDDEEENEEDDEEGEDENGKDGDEEEMESAEDDDDEEESDD
ncbi:neurofilament light polypeptide-like [Daphnia carinata]|uniref:neurofilament light polypeptide-like n=1 Tax=Daphnia carinata TaxID=120202 RepID=UPI00257BD978|nr:neurofilament light polypeptide-like [Daphnia carinata]